MSGWIWLEQMLLTQLTECRSNAGDASSLATCIVPWCMKPRLQRSEMMPPTQLQTGIGFKVMQS